MTILKTARNIASGLISIVYKQLKDANNKNKNLKTNLYHMALKTML